MTIVLHPRAAPGDRLRVWIGIFQQTVTPVLNWELDGNPVQPRALRNISSVRADDILPAGKRPEQTPRAFTGVYEFDGVQPGRIYSVRVQTDRQRSKFFRFRTMAAKLPRGPERWFNVLLVSCFHQAEDRSGRAGRLVSQLKAAYKPHLTFLMGDQVYLDLPTLKDFPNDESWLAQKFEQDYTLNWQGPPGYAHILNVAPSVSIPDDHEYWNNFPHPATVIQNSWTKNGRDRWQRAAEAMYKGFQQPYPQQLGEPFILNVSPMSFFLADMRHHRDFNLNHVMSDVAHQQLENWVSRIIAQKQFAVFVSGQSLFAEGAGKIKGAIGDYQLPDYQDYERLNNTLMRLVDAGRPLICVTGDVHWGRLTEAQDTHTGYTAIREVISSPASLVTFVGADNILEARERIKGIFGSKKDPWPRHPHTASPPDFFAHSVLKNRIKCWEPIDKYKQRGNHVALLSFQETGGGVNMRLIFKEIPLDGSQPQSEILGPFLLRDRS